MTPATPAADTPTARALVIGLGVFAAYSLFLNVSPVYLAHDEVLFALQSQSIAATGRDTSGHLFPLFAQLAPGYWVPTYTVYFTAFLLKLLPLSQTTIRLPMVAMGAASVALVYLVARRFLQNDRGALLAAAMLALAPTHFLMSRLGVDSMYPLPFALLWLLCLRAYADGEGPSRLVLATAALGAGVYTYIASLFMMPLYFVFTLVWLAHRREHMRSFVLAAAGFLVPLIPFALWLFSHPTASTLLLRRYQTPAAVHVGLAHMVIDRLSLYWNCFNPAFLFARVDDTPTATTFRAGLFLLPVSVFFAAGLREVAGWRDRGASWLLFACLLTAPLGVVLVGDRTVARLLLMLPFVALIASAGASRLFAASRPLTRLVAAGLLVLMPLQFGYYLYDYFTDYPSRSAFRFESNRRDAIPAVMRRVPQGSTRPIYLAGDVLWLEEYWRFYAIAEHRDDLIGRYVLFNPREAWTMPKGSVILTSADRERHEPRAAAAGATRVQTVLDADGSEAFTIFERP